MLKGLVHFSRFYTNTNSRSLRWLQGGQSTGQHLGQVVQLTMQAAERGDTLSTAEVDLYIIPMARGPRTAEEKASEEKKGAEEIRGLIHPDTPREMEEIAELMMHLRVQEEQKRQDEAFAKQRKAERGGEEEGGGEVRSSAEGGGGHASEQAHWTAVPQYRCRSLPFLELWGCINHVRG